MESSEDEWAFSAAAVIRLDIWILGFLKGVFWVLRFGFFLPRVHGTRPDRPEVFRIFSHLSLSGLRFGHETMNMNVNELKFLMRVMV